MTSFDVSAAADHLLARIDAAPAILIVLGSGLGALERRIDDGVVVPFDDVPGFPPTTVEGHAGRYVAGRLGGVPTLLQCGRFHMYEGGGPELVAAPARVAAALGVRIVVLTNAAGGVRRTLGPGDLVLLDDHVNWMFTSPLFGPVRAGEERFPDMSEPYDRVLRRLALEAASEMGERVEEGTYAAVLGPQYETPSEVRLLECLGVDVVGMSTVPEVLIARALGLRCLAFSVVTNEAAGIGRGPLRHDEVVERGRVGGERLARVIARLVPRLADELYSVSTK